MYKIQQVGFNQPKATKDSPLVVCFLKCRRFFCTTTPCSLDHVVFCLPGSCHAASCNLPSVFGTTFPFMFPDLSPRRCLSPVEEWIEQTDFSVSQHLLKQGTLRHNRGCDSDVHLRRDSTSVLLIYLTNWNGVMCVFWRLCGVYNYHRLLKMFSQITWEESTRWQWNSLTHCLLTVS